VTLSLRAGYFQTSASVVNSAVNLNFMLWCRQCGCIDSNSAAGKHYQLLSGDNCKQLKAAEAFAIIAVIITLIASICFLLSRSKLSVVLYFISGVSGLIGWALVSSVGKSREGQTLGFTLTDSVKLEPGFSAALNIVAWILGLIILPIYAHIYAAKLQPTAGVFV